MRTKPTTEAEFKALAFDVAVTRLFKDASHIFNARSVRSVETGRVE